jgi:hypothetical protein
MDTDSDGNSYGIELTVFNSNTDSNADSNADYNTNSSTNYNANSIAKSNDACKAPT